MLTGKEGDEMTAEEVAKDIVVAWLQRTEINIGDKSGERIGLVYQDVVKAVKEVQTKAAGAVGGSR